MKTKQLQFGKYVIINGVPVLFPLEMMHSDVVTQGQSAGFFVLRITSYDIEVLCWGESTSLNLYSDQARDALIIKDFINTIAGAFLKYNIDASESVSTNCL